MFRVSKYLLAGVVLVAATVPARAQHEYYQLAAQHGQARVYHEAFALPGGRGPAVVVAFRIPNSQLVFVRNRQETPGRAFVAQAEVTVQLFDGARKVGEEVWRKEQYAAAFEETQSRTLDLTGTVAFDVPPGRYGYRIILKDENTSQPRPSWLRPVDVPAFEGAAVGSALAVRQLRTETGGVVLELAALGGDLPYGERALVVVPVHLPRGTAPADVQLRYTLYRRDPAEVRDAERRQQAARERSQRAHAVDPDAPPLLDAPLPVPQGEVVQSGTVDAAALVPVGGLDAAPPGATLRWAAAPGPAPAPDGYLARLDLGSDQLADGAYVLEVTLAAGGVPVTRVSRFRTHWRNMPVSLYSPEVAIRNLSFIEERKAVRAMLRGTAAEQEAAIRAFWKERDPTPATEFNELMAEYYRRVDHAATAFRTGRNPYPDGLETDQARIYVVHGPADRVDRSFPPSGGVQEVWAYAGGQHFVFWAPSSIDAFELQADASR